MAPTTRKVDESGRLITVLVTGFGPFQDRYPVNPSFEIAKSLPQLLPRSAADCEAVQVITHGSPIRVAYREAHKLVPMLLDAHSEAVDLVLHIGMASGRKYYAAERYGHRDDYSKHKDLDGAIPPNDEVERCFGDCPPMLETSLNFERVVQKWQSMVSLAPDTSPIHDADCRPSDDAGHYLCDYTYFNSLAWYGRRCGRLQRGKATDRPVLFLHVPPESDEAALERGRAVAVSLIRAMVDDYVGV
ncbi:hypothetical protein BAUCODRAFT_501692 [Baudoinia panamericana UAMH 10762]|uniref:Peptidase C15, pyroglutamyl peptidase I-like protein n=1 Tax=Baudoinia panamericana (strain UAMH 10762) TaxID=717646 RepID=M2N9F3_BAUPA|nr:uncharacterized protein BAUCODRAFT_501692 [Baudoinia panamericana UAMH 10762]EMC95739.1 hypothetical protein BAUCODRAFT_501692 [Baudoinia panamericana UAMH 10762]